MLTKNDIDIVKQTIPTLEAGGTAITDHFYNRLFEHQPELKDLFNMSNQHTGTQRVALFEAILAYAKNIDNLSVLKQAVERIAHKHTTFHIQPAHYDIVGLHLIETFRELLGEAFTPAIEHAWGQAYQALAGVFINLEESLYANNESQSGGWRGKRAFRLVEKQVESELVTSFTFVPVDEQGVVSFLPGQYIGIEIESEELEHVEIRQYSLSDTPNDSSYRISVKRELGDHKGQVSNYLHDFLAPGDVVDLYPPAGDFHFTDNKTPVVLVSAGVGVTPMQSMLEYLAQSQYSESVHYLHACENPAQHSFNDRVQTLCQANQWQHVTWYNDSAVAESQSIKSGLMDFTATQLPLLEANYYICGPVGFMKFAKTNLLALGVDEANIHYEVFGPHANF